MNRYKFLFTSFLIGGTSFGQSPSDKPKFQAPMNIPIELSGNFMELRSDHFHSGLDMRTGGQEGQPVRSAGEGWVSRIKISPWGYGKAVYIDHPNGYTTVYGHLRELTGAVAELALATQYKEKCFDIDLYVDKGKLPLKAGELFAYSGNSGGSGGPHLHFEVRRSSDQHALDPEAYGMVIPDRVPPTLRGLRIDVLDTNARTAPYPGNALGYALVARNDSTYVLKEGAVPQAFGTVGVSVNVFDHYSNSGSKCGIRKLEVQLDGTTIHTATLDEVDFSQNRYANAYMDYRLFKDNSMDYNRCYRLPGNGLNLYGKEAAQGRITPEPGKDHQVTVIATDAHGNRSKLSFTLRGATAESARAWVPARQPGTLFRYDRENRIEQNGMRFTLPAKALYQDDRITLTKANVIGPKAYAPMHRLGDPYIPLHVQGEVSIQVEKPVTVALVNKLVVVKTDHAGKSAAIGGTHVNGWVTARTKAFGTFTVMADTVAPKVTNLDLKPVMTGRSGFRVRVDDDLSGVEIYTGQLDGNWILMDYDPKTKTLSHRFDVHSDLPGKHVFTLEVTDERRNRTTFRQEFTR